MHNRLLKLVLLTTALLPHLAPLFADQVGLQAGASFTSFSSSTSLPTPSSTTDLLVNGFYELGILGPLKVQPEITYRGAGDSGDWLTAAVLAKAKLPVTPFLKPYLLFGPEAAFRLSNSGYKSVDYTLDAGAGLELAIAPMLSVLVTGRYCWGLSDVRNASTTAGSLNSRHFYLMGGIGLDL